MPYGDYVVPDEHKDPVYPPMSTPMKVAQKLAKDIFAQGDNPTLIFWNKNFWAYNGNAWEKQDDLDVKGPMWYQLEKAVVEDSKGNEVAWAPTTSKVSGLMEPLALETKAPKSLTAPAWLNQPDRSAKGTVALHNGILDYKTGVLHPHTPAYLNTYSLKFDYDPTATCPLWERTLAQSFAHDHKGLAALQEWFGYIVSGRTDLQRMLIFIGPPGAGKGVINGILKKLIGEENVVAPSLDRLSGKFDLAQWEGKQLALMEDARDGGNTEVGTSGVSTILSVTGKDPITIERKGIDSYTIPSMSARLMITANVEPTFRDNTGAIKRRILGIQIGHFDGAVDTKLDVKLAAELPGIFNWALVGLARLEAVGDFTEPDSQRELTDTMAELGSPVVAFLEDTYTITGGADDLVPVGDAYVAYERWCRDEGKHPLNKSKFSTEVKGSSLSRQGVKLTQREVGPWRGESSRKRERFIQGINL